VSQKYILTGFAIYFVINRCFILLFRTSNIDTVKHASRSFRLFCL